MNIWRCFTNQLLHWIIHTISAEPQGEKKEFDLEQRESFEALTSRFARASDILTQKVLKTLFILLQENTKTIIDVAKLLEKQTVLESADDLLNVRELRNQIAHEYLESNVKALFFDVLRYVPEIKKIINNFTEYYQKQFSSTKPDEETKQI